MNMPGFTAEASLYNVNERYQAITAAPHYGGIVQPATHPHFNDLSVANNPPLFGCLRYICSDFYDPRTGKKNEICWWSWVC